MATFQTKDRISWFKRDLEANFEGYFRGLPGGELRGLLPRAPRGTRPRHG